MADKAEFACECDYMCGRRLAERGDRMSEELKPCPFCGGEASIESGRYWKAEKWMEVDE